MALKILALENGKFSVEGVELTFEEIMLKKPELIKEVFQAQAKTQADVIKKTAETEINRAKMDWVKSECLRLVREKNLVNEIADFSFEAYRSPDFKLGTAFADVKITEDDRKKFYDMAEERVQAGGGQRT